MHARIVTIAATALLVSASANAAEPAKKATPQTKQTQTRSTPVVLASAEEVSPGPNSDAAQPPVKRRAARVTTCRCGGDPQPAQPEEQ